jgi:glycosyltransferase involved in cell wall biosynthesis
MHADLSVVLSNYNHAKFLPRAIEAILSQSTRPREVLLIDDASTDNSLAIMERYARRESGIRIVRNPVNLGVIESINRGVREAQGKYLCLCAADDLVLPGLFEKSVALLERHPQALISCAWGSTFDAETNVVRLCRNGWAKVACYLTPAELAEVIGPTGVPATSALYRRAEFVAAGPYDAELNWHTDWFVNLVLAFRGGLCYLPEPLGLVRVASGSYSHRGQQNRDAHYLTIAAVIRRLLSPEYADIRPFFQTSGLLGFFGPDVMRGAALLPENVWATALPLLNVLLPHDLEPLCADDDPAVQALARLLAGPAWRRRLLVAPTLRNRLQALLPQFIWRLATRTRANLLAWLPGPARRWTRFLRKSSPPTEA